MRNKPSLPLAQKKDVPNYREGYLLSNIQSALWNGNEKLYKDIVLNLKRKQVQPDGNIEKRVISVINWPVRFGGKLNGTKASKL